MKAVVYREYGSPERISIEDVPVPEIADDQVLVRIHAASVNPLDWHELRGKPYLVRTQAGLFRPKIQGLGADLAGTVTAVGPAVTRFAPGDEVMGMSIRTLAEFAAVRERGLVHKPANVSFEQAAAVPLAATTALQGLRDHGGLLAGQRVLINGASGGVGHFAVQIARILGADVTGVTSTRNLAMVRSLGASRVIDYTAADFTELGQWDLVLDCVGNRSLRDLRRALTSSGTLVLCGAPRGQWLGPVLVPLRAAITSKFVGQRLGSFYARRALPDLETLAGWLGSGELRAVVEGTWRLEESAGALADLEGGHVAGKLVVCETATSS